MGRAKRTESAASAASNVRGAAFRCSDNDYFRWRTSTVTARDRKIEVASKPGVPGFTELDPSETLLLDHLVVETTSTVCTLHCGSGTLGALAALMAPEGRVWMIGDHHLSVEAARQTAAANNITNAEVLFSAPSETLPTVQADVVAIRLPKGRLPILQMLWTAFHALRPGGRCYLAGGTDEGVKSALNFMQHLFGNATLVAYRGGHRLGFARRPDRPALSAGDFDMPWLDPDCFHRFEVTTSDGTIDVHSRPGVFSWDRFDAGTEALLQVIDVRDATHILDLGCGAGVVGIAAALQAPRARVTMLDVSAEAVRSSRRTVEANGLNKQCEVMPSDVAAAVAERTFSTVLTNPPFHTGKSTDLSVPAQFIRDAARVLAPGGKLYLVANRTLPYEAWLTACFGSYHTAVDGRQFKVLSAVRRP